MAYKVFLDTNIVLDLFHHEGPFHANAIELFYHLENKEFTAFYSESVITTTTYILRKTTKPHQINKIVTELNKKIQILPCIQSLIMQSPPGING